MNCRQKKPFSREATTVYSCGCQLAEHESRQQHSREAAEAIDRWLNCCRGFAANERTTS